MFIFKYTLYHRKQREVIKNNLSNNKLRKTILSHLTFLLHEILERLEIIRLICFLVITNSVNKDVDSN